MSDDSKDDKPQGSRRPSSLTPQLDEDRPLDAFLPEMTERGAPKRVGSSEALEKSALHPRVLEVELEESMEWAWAAWEDPGQMSLLGHLERLIEGTLLSEMSQPASRADLLDRRFRAAELLAFDELYPETRFGLEKMGFEATDFRSDRYNERMDAWREEAREIGHEVPRQPDSVWRSEFETPDPALESKLSDVHAEMTRSMGTEVWGEQPGSPSKRMAEKLRQYFNTSIAPNPDGLDTFELFVVQEGGDYVRWMQPLVFQSFCDFIGVVLQAHYGLGVEWALCEADERGFVPPPLFRLRKQGSVSSFPIGLHLVRWAMMPARTDQSGSVRSELERAIKAL